MSTPERELRRRLGEIPPPSYGLGDPISEYPYRHQPPPSLGEVYAAETEPEPRGPSLSSMVTDRARDLVPLGKLFASSAAVRPVEGAAAAVETAPMPPLSRFIERRLPEPVREAAAGVRERVRGVAGDVRRGAADVATELEEPAQDYPWVARTLSQGLGSSVLPLATGTGAFRAARAAGTGLKAAVGLATGGAAAGALPMSAGEMHRELTEAGVEGDALGYGVQVGGAMIAGLEAVVPADIVTRVLPGARRAVGKSLARVISRGAVRGGGQEAVTEAIQQQVPLIAREILAENPELHRPGFEEHLMQTLEAAAAGALVGGVLGGGGAGVGRVRGRGEPAAAPEPEREVLGEVPESVRQAVDNYRRNQVVEPAPVQPDATAVATAPTATQGPTESAPRAPATPDAEILVNAEGEQALVHKNTRGGRPTPGGERIEKPYRVTFTRPDPGAAGGLGGMIHQDAETFEEAKRLAIEAGFQPQGAGRAQESRQARAREAMSPNTDMSRDERLAALQARMDELDRITDERAPTLAELDEVERIGNDLQVASAPTLDAPISVPRQAPESLLSPEPTPGAPAPAVGAPSPASVEAGPEARPSGVELEPARAGRTTEDVEQDVQERPSIEPAVRGQPTKIVTADDAEYDAEYAIVASEDAPSSHDPFGFEPTPGYPEGLQERRYHADRSAQEEVAKRAAALNPDRILDPTFSATEGPPIVTQTGVRLSGNQRGMLVQRAREHHPERFQAYVAQLVERAEQFGMSAEEAQTRVSELLEQGRTPELVRVMGPAADASSRELVSKFNDPGTKARDVLGEASTRSRRLEESAALGKLTESIGSDQTVRAYLGTAASRPFVQELVAGGVIPSQEASRFVDQTTGLLSEEGRTLTERMLEMLAIGDPETVARAPRGWLRKIEKAAPAVVQTKAAGWDISSVLAEAMDAGAAARANDMKLEDLGAQTSLLGGEQEQQFSPLAIEVAKFLESTNPNAVSRALRSVAEDATARSTVDMFGTRAESLEESVAKHLTIEGAESQLFQPRTPLERQGAGERGFFDPSAVSSGSTRERIMRVVRSAAQKYLTTRGTLPEPVFDRKVKRDGWVTSQMKAVEFTGREFNRAIRQIKGVRGVHDLTDSELAAIDDAYKGDREVETLPGALQPVVRRMREQTDALSKHLMRSGAIEGPLVPTVEANLGHYATRSYRVFDDPKWAEKVPDEIRNRAKSLIRAELAEHYNEDLFSPSDDFEQRVEGVVAELLHREETSPLQFAAGKLGSKDLSILRRRHEIAPEIRQLLGEWRDPRINYVRSMAKMANLLANHEFLVDVREQGLGSFLFEEPRVVDGIEHAARIAAEGSQTMNPLNGLYTTPEIKLAFEEINQPAVAGAFLRRYMKLNGAVKVSKTVLSPMTHVRNFVANPLFLVANGNNPLAYSKEATSAITANLGVLGRDTDESRALYRRLQELGVVDESAKAGELRDIIRDATKRGGPAEFMVDPTMQIPQRALKVAQDLYRAEDDYWKIVAFYSEKAKYAKAMPDASDQALEEHAARIVRSTLPTYSLVPRGVKVLRRVPLVGTFVSFPAEVFRTGANTLLITSRELQSENPAVRKIGARRLAGVMTAATIVPAMAAASRMLFGIDRDEDEDLREFLPPWSRNSTIVYLGTKPNGDVRYIDLSYTDPYAYIRKPVQALLHGEDYEEQLAESARELLEPFIGEEILAGKLGDVWRNKRKTGGEVYNEADPFIAQLQDVTTHVWDAFEPGFISQGERIALGLSGRQSQTGRSYDPKEEVAAVVTGVRVNSLDVQQSFSFRSRESLSGYRNAGRILTGVLGRRGEVGEDEIEKAYSSANAARSEAWEDASRYARAANRLGVELDDVQRILDQNGWSKRDARAIALGYEAQVYSPSESWFKSLAGSVGSTEARRRKRAIRRLRTSRESDFRQEEQAGR